MLLVIHLGLYWHWLRQQPRSVGKLLRAYLAMWMFIPATFLPRELILSCLFALAVFWGASHIAETEGQPTGSDFK